MAMDNDQQAAVLALIVTALKLARLARDEGAFSPMLRALEQDAIVALENLPEVTR